jgi:hypothetical protein
MFSAWSLSLEQSHSVSQSVSPVSPHSSSTSKFFLQLLSFQYFGFSSSKRLFSVYWEVVNNLGFSSSKRLFSVYWSIQQQLTPKHLLFFYTGQQRDIGESREESEREKRDRAREREGKRSESEKERERRKRERERKREKERERESTVPRNITLSPWVPWTRGSGSRLHLVKCDGDISRDFTYFT